MATSTFQLTLDTSTGLFSLSKISGPLDLDGFKVLVPAGASNAEIVFETPQALSIRSVAIQVELPEDSPADIYAEPPINQPVTLYNLNVGGREVSLWLFKLTADSLSFLNTNETGGDLDVAFGFELTLASESVIYRTRDPQIEDEKDGG